MHPGEYDSGMQQLKSEKLREELNKARQLYFKGKLEEAYEQDIFLPRIKRRNFETLRNIAKRQGIDIIDVQKSIPLLQSSSFFCDYCHPIQPANKLILEEFLKIVRKSTQQPPNSVWRILFDSAPFDSTPSDSIYPLW